LHKLIGRAALALALLPLTGCGLGSTLFGAQPNGQLGQTAVLPSVFGYVVADEPQAALVARQILNEGGNAADAAAAAGFALSVTLPSRAGLGGGGACVIHVPDADGKPRPAVALLFPPGTPASSGGDRPAAVPAMARGLLAMDARYGVLDFDSVIVPAERLAGGVPVSRALAADLAVVGDGLLADPAEAEVFAGPDGQVLTAGETLSQPDLAATLERLRTGGVPGFYAGSAAASFVAAADTAGGGLTAGDLAAGLPEFAPPQLQDEGGDEVAIIPSAAVTAPAMPASAAFAVLDRNGGVVACATTMNNLFGTGRIAPGTGVLLAASPRGVPLPVLGGAIAYRPGDGAFRAAVTGTGEQGAALAVAQGVAEALRGAPVAVPDPGRANVISCPGGVPGGEASCTAAADPRGLGLAVGGR
jgi:gamma-glutamyltranspeptidase/glutathione hydrolase